MAVSHIKSNAAGDWTGTVTVFNTAGLTQTVAATNLVRPTDWNSGHNQFYSLTGNTSLSSTASGTNVIWSGGSNITLVGSSDSIQIIGQGPPTLSFYDNLIPAATAFSNQGDATLHVFPFTPANELFIGNMSVSTLMLNVTQSVSTAATWTNRMSIGFYTSVNSTSIALVFSASTSWGTAAGNANINNSFGGPRWLTFHSSQFNVAPNFAQGVRYWVGMWNRTSNNAGSMTLNIFGNLTLAPSSARSGIMGAASVSNTTLGWQRFNGIYSVSITTALPANLSASDINKNNVNANFLPQVILNNVGSNVV